MSRALLARAGKSNFLGKTRSFNALPYLHKEALKKLGHQHMHTLQNNSLDLLMFYCSTSL